MMLDIVVAGWKFPGRRREVPGSTLAEAGCWAVRTSQGDAFP